MKLQKIIGLASALLLASWGIQAAEVQTSNFDETAASNNAAAPNGWPEGMAPSAVNDTARDDRAGLKRWFNRWHGLSNAGALISTGGTSAAYTVTFSTAPASLFTGFQFCTKFNAANSAGATINVNALGAKTMQKMTTAGYANLLANDILNTQTACFRYDGTLDRMILLTPSAPMGSAMTDPMTTRGDIIIRNSSNVTARLGVGAASRYVSSDGTDVSWGQVSLTAGVTGVLPSANMTAATTAVSGISQLADAAAMEAETASRTVQADLVKRSPGTAKAWCFFDGTTVGTNACTASYNVTNVTRVATGRYTINFTTAFSTANYVCVGMSAVASTLEDSAGTQTTTAFPLRTQNSAGTATDNVTDYVVCFGDQ